MLRAKNADEVLRPEWLLLLSRIGDDTMFYILRYCSVFVPGDGMHGLLQLSGTSVNKVGLLNRANSLNFSSASLLPSLQMLGVY